MAITETILNTLYSLSTFSSATPWIIAVVHGGDDNPQQLLHPLTLQPHLFNLPKNFNLNNFRICTLTSFNHTNFAFDKLVIPPSKSKTINDNTILVLYRGGQLLGRLPFVHKEDLSTHWVKLSGEMFDDIVVFKGKVYAVDRQGKLYVIDNNLNKRKLNLGKTVITRPITHGSGQVGWRKRFVVDGREMYLVVRMEEKVFKVYMLIRVRNLVYWREVIKGFNGGKVLFMAKDCYFFASEFVEREYENCIVYSEEGFPEYGKDCWEFVRKCEDDFGVFRLSDASFGRVGESVGFPKINWSPPSWIFDDESLYSRSRSEREPDEDEGLDSNSRGEKYREAQSDLKDSNSKDEEEQEVMEFDSESQDQEQEERKSDSDIQDLEDGKIQFDSNSQEKEDEEMHSNANIVGDASWQEDVSPSSYASVSAVEEEVTRTLLHMNGGNEAIEKETSRKNITSVPRACTSSTTKSYKSDSATAKFEGFDIRSDLVPTLQKIWRKHGNIIENSTMRSGDIIAKALESLATVVQILENNSVQSLTDCQTDYLSSTLSDLRCMCFKVSWLISFVEKAVKLHKSKALVDSLNKLSQLSSQVEERRGILIDELAKLTKEENKLKKEIAKVSKMIPFSGQVKFDEPLGSGLK